MKRVNTIITFFLLYHSFVFQVFADEGHLEGTPHAEEAVALNPVLIIGLVIALAISGLILWKFVLRSPMSPSPTQSAQPEKPPTAQEKSVHSDEKNSL